MAATSLLFLIADTGGGHRASARAVAGELAAVLPGRSECHIVDAFAEVSPWLIGRTADLYEPIVRRVPWFWGGLYHSSNSRLAVRLLLATALRAVEPGVRRLVGELHPAAVVSFHPLLNHVAARALRNGSQRVPLITVITDLIAVHRSWVCPEVDALVTPSPAAHAACLAAGMPADRCELLGLPVDRRFQEPPPGSPSRRELRQALGLPHDRFTVLLCGGAVGSGGLVARARALAAADIDAQLAVVCGRNAAATAALEGLQDRQGHGVIVKGFVDNMPEWLRAVDVLVTKAGPGAIAEALCSGTPMLLSSYLPGQERGNMEWAVHAGVARYVPRVGDLAPAVADLAAPGSTALAAMRDAVARSARPGATSAIAQLIMRLAGEPS